jgi:EF-P beta-lysylation protein EpmB
MTHSVTQNNTLREDWLTQLSEVISDPIELLRILSLADHPQLQSGSEARRLFPLRVPRSYLSRINAGDANDPLLLQVITQSQEFITASGYSQDPLEEQHNILPGLLHKYRNRALLLVKTGCAINCRYCFRRHFPYQDNQGSKANWQRAIDYIGQHPELDEIIFSGGDPLMAKDHELDWLITQLEAIPHLRRLRIHSRLISAIPARATEELCRRLSSSRFQVILVTHINHANEIDREVAEAMSKLKQSGVVLLNQSVLLRGVNDNAETLAALSNKLFDSGIMPYYLHVLDKVQGAAHFMVSDDEARAIMQKLLSLTSGYLVPRLTREIGGRASKTPLNLGLE